MVLVHALYPAAVDHEALSNEFERAGDGVNFKVLSRILVIYHLVKAWPKAVNEYFPHDTWHFVDKIKVTSSIILSEPDNNFRRIRTLLRFE
jgi:hypothetical protein